MAQETPWTVYLPDQSGSRSFPGSMTPEEVRGSLVGMGFSAVQTAELIINGNTLTFRRVAGGTKGL